ncbi:hypothetical protein ACNFJN_05395 [Xenorhabdus budapestensis]|uniref:Uncharacterized protein n=1 Tax=Xenorhabdus budapestensis TaxID=290110 RepID=A0ABX7VL92_XENBU|nr:hypothetical protein [Xenorhabdus budapestensis]QTL40711.1 hypothetical protein HGO23_04890 [Xenorhabdus budapestensis]
MNKDTMDYNDTDEPYYGPFTVDGNVIYLDVAAPNIDNIYVTIENLDTRKTIHDAQLTDGINGVVGSKLLSVLKMAFVYDKKVRVMGYADKRGLFIESVIIFK